MPRDSGALTAVKAGLQRSSFAPLEEIARETGDTVIHPARNGIYSQFIHVIQARSRMRFLVPQGLRRLAVYRSGAARERRLSRPCEAPGS
jgi:hypothetical protein